MPPEIPPGKPLILVTGFTSPGAKLEDQTALLFKLLSETPHERAEIRTQILPADPEGALLKAIEALDRLLPDAVIGLGPNDESSGMSVERVALNLDDREPSRPGGRTEPIDAAGPAAYFSTLPVHMMAERMRSGGVPAGVSNSAGTLLCNRLFYALLHYVALRGQETWFGRRPPAGLASRIGFIRLPAPIKARAARRPDAASAEMQVALRGVRLAIDSVVDFLPTLDAGAVV